MRTGPIWSAHNPRRRSHAISLFNRRRQEREWMHHGGDYGEPSALPLCALDPDTTPARRESTLSVSSYPPAIAIPRSAPKIALGPGTGIENKRQPIPMSAPRTSPTSSFICSAPFVRVGQHQRRRITSFRPPLGVASPRETRLPTRQNGRPLRRQRQELLPPAPSRAATRSSRRSK